MHDGNRPLGNVYGRTGTTLESLRATAPSRTRALAASAGLSLLFLIVYGGCIWITSRRSAVGVFYFGWERGIPFVPFFILPYMSIDLFFVAAPFLLSAEDELKIFVRRIQFAIVVAGLFFLLLPLRFAFPRPQTDGWLGLVFDWFRGLDQPFNLFPSLHAALCLLLLPVYARRLWGIPRAVVLFWFALIALSPLLTYQHHVIDILGGFALAAGCFVGIRPKILSPLPGKLLHHPPNDRL